MGVCRHGPGPAVGGWRALGRLPALLIDLRQLQRQSAAADPALLRRCLSSAPPGLVAAELPVLICGDPQWGESPAAGVLLAWLGQRPRHFCLVPELGQTCLEALQALYGFDEVCVPSLHPPAWPRTRFCAPDGTPSLPPRSPGTRLAYISPMPPQRSGISTYSLALLPHLARHFSIDVVTESAWDGPPPEGVLSVLTPLQFASRAHHYDHVLYHLGNSSAHLEIMRLLGAFPGVVVLHDFFLGHVVCSPESDEWLGGSCLQRLYASHGYQACLAYEASQQCGDDHVIWAYPCNLPLLQQADGVIVHSREALRLAESFYGPTAAEFWTLIPHLKQEVLPEPTDRSDQRARLDLAEDSLVICTFGFLGVAKRSLLLLEAFLASTLASDPRCALVFAGSAGSDQRLLNRMRRAIRRARAEGGLLAEVRITGWIDTADYLGYLAAADLAVQLRSSSRGETSGTVLDCLAGGVPLIVNEHGSLREIPEGCALRLSEACDTTELARALESLARDPERRRRLVERGRREIAERHRPDHCAARYAEALHHAGEQSQRRQQLLTPFRRQLPEDPQQIVKAANTLGLLFPPEPRQRQLFLDVSALAEQDLGSGVQRVVRSICQQLLARPPVGFRVEPVVACSDGLGYRYARHFTTTLVQAAVDELEDGPVAWYPGDVFLGIDLSHHVVVSQRAYYAFLRAQGVEVHFVVHDLLPCFLPECFPPGASERHRAWLDVVLQADGAVCVSRSVMEELKGWRLERQLAAHESPYRLGWFHHGADFQRGTATVPTQEEITAVEALGPWPTLLMVGTVEPRKAYLEVLEAATALWQNGATFNLVIVGREGWTDLPDPDRRTLPATVAAIRRHPLLHQQLFWFDAASDSLLQCLYQRSSGLIGASFGEGFGIPLIEAASFGLPLLLRDLPVFHEVTGGHASFFPSKASRQALSESIARFLEDISGNAAAAHGHRPAPFTPQSWSQSADQLVEAIGLQPGADPAPFVGAPSLASPDATMSSEPPASRPRRRQRWRRRLSTVKERIKRLLRPAHHPTPFSEPVGTASSPECLLPGAEAWLQELRRQR